MGGGGFGWGGGGGGVGGGWVCIGACLDVRARSTGLFFAWPGDHGILHSFPTRRYSDLALILRISGCALYMVKLFGQTLIDDTPIECAGVRGTHI